MPVWNVVRKGVYHDSVILMRLTRVLESVHGVRRAAVMMGTPANRAILQDAGLLTPDGDSASSNDLVIAVEGEDMAIAHAGVEAAETSLSKSRVSTDTDPMTHRPRTLRAALKMLDTANLALISVPGPYAGLEALKALRAGLHVMLFSDNVPVPIEIELKRLALANGLLMMGPDCGTAILNGTPLGFANILPRGRIGLAAASGTGLQEVSCLIAAAGEGISQAIGVGGRDLSDMVGGLMMSQALDVLAADAATEVVCMLGKPPGPGTWERLQAKLAQLEKPCMVHGAGSVGDAGRSWHAAKTLEDAAQGAVALARRLVPEPTEFTIPGVEIERLIARATRLMQPDQRFVRGIYAGGTLAHEALSLLQDTLLKGVPGRQWSDDGHSVIDLGDDRFTVGRPHPMIDGTLRREWIFKAADDPSTAVILLDVILGYGSHPDPAGELLPAIQQATRQAQAAGRHLAVVVSVCGTEQDPQRRSAQIAVLHSNGVIVMPSNAQAARLAAGIATRLTENRH
jgi:succinyl-CoA synthetase alpha subunit